MDTELTIHIPEELSRQVEERAAREGTSLDEVVRQSLEQYIAERPKSGFRSMTLSEARKELASRPSSDAPKPGARFMNIKDFDPNYKLTDEEAKAAQETFARMEKLVEEIAIKTAGQPPVDAVELVREGRRDFL